MIIVTPVTGIQRKIDAFIYEPIRLAILQSLIRSKGKTFTQLTDEVVKIIHTKCRTLKNQYPGKLSPYGLTWKQEGLWKLLPKGGKS